jgi:hypothetical protein
MIVRELWRACRVPLAMSMAMLPLSCTSGEGGCEGAVIVVVMDASLQQPLCDATLAIVLGAERIPVETPAACRSAYPVPVGHEAVVVEASASGYRTSELTLEPWGIFARRCDGSRGCEVVGLAEQASP